MTEITRLLEQARADPRAEDALYTAVFGELRILARAVLRRGQTVSGLEAGSLVGEAWLRLRGRRELAFESRGRFFAYASQVMRSVVLDLARERASARRGGGCRAVTLSTTIADGGLDGTRLVAVDQALQALARLDPRGHGIFEMHFFGGLEIGAICEATCLSPATVKRALRMARAFLFDELGAGVPA